MPRGFDNGAKALLLTVLEYAVHDWWRVGATDRQKTKRILKFCGMRVSSYNNPGSATGIAVEIGYGSAKADWCRELFDWVENDYDKAMSELGIVTD